VTEKRGHFIGAQRDVRALRDATRGHIGDRIVADPELCFACSRKDGVKHRAELVNGCWRGAGLFQVNEERFNAFARNPGKREAPNRLRQYVASEPQSLGFYTRSWAAMVKPPLAADGPFRRSNAGCSGHRGKEYPWRTVSLL
jgi:hypothetical protein